MTTDAAGRTRQVDRSVAIVVLLALTASLGTVVGHDGSRVAEPRPEVRVAEARDPGTDGARGRAAGRRTPPVAGLEPAPTPARRVVVVRRSRAS